MSFKNFFPKIKTAFHENQTSAIKNFLEKS